MDGTWDLERGCPHRGPCLYVGGHGACNSVCMLLWGFRAACSAIAVLGQNEGVTGPELVGPSDEHFLSRTFETDQSYLAAALRFSCFR